MRSVKRAVQAVSEGGAYLSAIGIVTIMLGTTADVARRSLAGQSLPGIVEGSEVVLAVAVFLGLGYAEQTSTHVATDIVTSRVPPTVRATMFAVGRLVMCALLAWMTVATAQRAVDSVVSNEFRFGMIRVPLWPGRTAIALGFALVVLEALIELVTEAGKAIRR